MYTDNTLYNPIKYTIDANGQYTTQCNKMHYIDVYGQEKPHVYTCCGGGAIRGTSRGVRQRNEGKFRPAFTLFTNTNRKTHFANKKNTIKAGGSTARAQNVEWVSG